LTVLTAGSPFKSSQRTRTQISAGAQSTSRFKITATSFPAHNHKQTNRQAGRQADKSSKVETTNPQSLSCKQASKPTNDIQAERVTDGNIN